jgi:hypothetical protein
MRDWNVSVHGRTGSVKDSPCARWQVSLADGCPSGTPERQAASRGIHIKSNADANRNTDLRLLIADLKFLMSSFSIQ